MISLHYELIIRILIAHLLSDFVFQPNKWAEQKDSKGYKTKYFYFHILVTGIILSILIFDWTKWDLILIITGIHFIIDVIKSVIITSERFWKFIKDNLNSIYKRAELWVLIVDQILHLITIILIWLLYTNQLSLFISKLLNVMSIQNFWIYLLAYIFLTIPSSIIIGYITDFWYNEIKISEGKQLIPLGFQVTNSNNSSGLEGAGSLIGIIERLLIITFIIINQLQVIGFLLAAKSVFRFGDLKDNTHHKKTEYIIIGTFLSFSFAIFTGFILRHFIK